jgi:hypothetical protein
MRKKPLLLMFWRASALVRQGGFYGLGLEKVSRRQDKPARRRKIQINVTRRVRGAS